MFAARSNSARPIDVAAVLDAMDENDLFSFENLVDDSVIAAASDKQTCEFAEKRLAHAVRASGDRSEDRF